MHTHCVSQPVGGKATSKRMIERRRKTVACARRVVALTRQRERVSLATATTTRRGSVLSLSPKHSGGEWESCAT